MLKRVLRSLAHIQRESKSIMTCVDIDKNVYNEFTVIYFTLDLCRIPIFAREKSYNVEYILPSDRKGVIGFGADKK